MIDTLARVDLNLLIALHLLFEEENVTRAAERLGCSQSAMSQKLQRIREVLGDQLLVRHRRGMVLTERAREIAGPLSAALRALGDVVSPPRPFDPSSACAEIRIGARTAPVGFFPAFVSRISRLAPRLTLVCLHLTGEHPVTDRLANGDVDLIVQPRRTGGKSGLTRTHEEKVDVALYARVLMKTKWMCIVRTDHPDIQGSLDLEQFCAVGHILTSPRGDAYGLVDRSLKAIGRRRHIAAVTQDFMLSWLQVTQTDLLLTTNQMVAYHLQPILPAQLLPVPIEMPKGETIMLWHERTHYAAMHRWLRQQLAQACAELMEQYSVW